MLHESGIKYQKIILTGVFHLWTKSQCDFDHFLIHYIIKMWLAHYYIALIGIDDSFRFDHQLRDPYRLHGKTHYSDDIEGHMHLVAGDMRDGKVQCDCTDRAYQHNHVRDLKSATTLSSIFHKLAQYPKLWI